MHQGQCPPPAPPGACQIGGGPVVGEWEGGMFVQLQGGVALGAAPGSFLIGIREARLIRP